MLRTTLAAIALATMVHAAPYEISTATQCGWIPAEHESECLDSLKSGRTFVFEKKAVKDSSGERMRFLVYRGNPVKAEATGVSLPRTERESLDGIDFSLKIMATLSCLSTIASLFILLK